MKNTENVYLDYSATTKADPKVLAYFNDLAQNYSANPNSHHLLGEAAKNKIDEAISNICDYFSIKEEELIFTSGASESNNLAIKGLAENVKGKHLITTELEHSSIYGPIGYLQKHGYRVDFVQLTKEGTVDLEHLKSLLKDDTFLVSICAIDSEVGIRQPIEEIGLLLKDYPNTYFHSDITQALGKVKLDLTNVDLASFSGHKIFCFKGIGGLIKRKGIKLTPLVHGGKSTTVFRSGTPATELIGALSESFNLFKNNLDEKYLLVKSLNKQLCEALTEFKEIYINSNEHSIPQILNISIMGRNSNDTQSFFTKHGISLSTKTACANNDDLSKSVLALTKDEGRALSSIRISLSYKTTAEEINYFIKVLRKYLGVK